MTSGRNSVFVARSFLWLLDEIFQVLGTVRMAVL
jgi:hypothetical protein